MNHDFLVLPAAILLDLILGDPRWFPHPVVAIGRLIKLLEKMLRNLVPNEKSAGILLLLLFIFAGIGYRKLSGFSKKVLFLALITGSLSFSACTQGSLETKPKSPAQESLDQAKKLWEDAAKSGSDLGLQLLPELKAPSYSGGKKPAIPAKRHR